MGSLAIRLLLIGMAVGGLIYALIWGVFSLLKVPMEVRAPANGPRRHVVICHKDQEVTMLTKKVCLYTCENGEKSKVEGVARCLQTIEQE